MKKQTNDKYFRQVKKNHKQKIRQKNVLIVFMGPDGSQHWFLKLIRGTLISGFLKIVTLFLSQMRKKKKNFGE